MAGGMGGTGLVGAWASLPDSIADTEAALDAAKLKSEASAAAAVECEKRIKQYVDQVGEPEPVWDPEPQPPLPPKGAI